jgi:hypothetical protein
MSKKAIILVTVIVLVIAAAILFWPRKKSNLYTTGGDNTGNTGSNTANSGKPGNTGGGSGAGANPARPTGSVFPLKRGSRGEEVKTLQKMINYDIDFYGWRDKKLTVDGVWGAGTDALVRGAYDNRFPSGEINEILYQWCLERYNKMLPISLRYESGNAWNWPLTRGDYGAKTRKLNIALKLYPKDTTDKKADHFTQRTADAVIRLNGGVSDKVTESSYRYLTQ